MRRWWLVLLAAAALVLTGCWDRVEIGDLAIVKVAGIDRAEAGLLLSVRVVIPVQAMPGGGGRGEGGGGGGPTNVIYAAEGQTVMDAIQKIQERVSRRLFLSHARLLVIGADYAREGVGPALDFWSRHREPRLRTHIAITPGRALDLIQAEPELEPQLGEAVREILSLRLQTEVTVRDFVEALRRAGEQPVAPRLERVASSPGEPQREVQVTGSAIFRNDRLIGWLNDAETRGLLWLRNEIQTGVITVTLPGGGKVTMQMVRGRTRVHTRMDGSRLRLAVEIDTEDDIFEATEPIDLGKGETAQVLAGLAEEAMRARIVPVLAKVQQEFRVDVLRFADAVRRGLPLQWEQRWRDRWAEEFPRVPVELSIKVHARRTGMHGPPLGADSKEVRARQKQLVPEKR